MNYLVALWSMTAASCATLGLLQLFLWFNDRRVWAYGLMAAMALAASASAFLEMSLFLAPTPGRAAWALLWLNAAIAAVLIPMVWAIKLYLPSARNWLAWLITALWTIGLLVNFLLPGNLTFSEVTMVHAEVTRLGDRFFVADGIINPLKWLADITILLIPVYVIDAAWHMGGERRRLRTLIITVGVVLFVLIAGVHAVLVDAGLLDSPYLISVGFLCMVFALTWVLARDAVRTGNLERDIEQAHRQTDQLMRANLMGEVAAALAHELNQPLTAILGNAQAAEQFLALPDPDTNEVMEILADIVRDDKRARDMIQHMRNMLRGDNDEEEVIDLSGLIHDILQFLQRDLDQRGIEVRQDIASDLPFVRGSRVALQQIIMNLVINAEHAVSQPGSTAARIEIEARAVDDGALITVSDHGPGLDQELLERLFEPFVSSKPGGLGMGLAICARIVEGHGGRIRGENGTAGGARFTLWFPEAAP